MKTEKTIIEYLAANGRMSGTDIVDDLGVTMTDVILAEECGEIIRVTPCPGGSGPWYAVSQNDN